MSENRFLLFSPERVNPKTLAVSVISDSGLMLRAYWAMVFMAFSISSGGMCSGFLFVSGTPETGVRAGAS